MTTKNPKTVTEKAAAQMLNVSGTTVRRACRRGMLEGVYGGLCGKRLKGVTVRSVQRLLHNRRCDSSI